MCKATLRGAGHRRLFACFGNRPIGEIVAPADNALAGNFDQANGLGFTRFEPHGGPSRYVEVFRRRDRSNSREALVSIKW